MKAGLVPKGRYVLLVALPVLFLGAVTVGVLSLGRHGTLPGQIVQKVPANLVPQSILGFKAKAVALSPITVLHFPGTKWHVFHLERDGGKSMVEAVVTPFDLQVYAVIWNRWSQSGTSSGKATVSMTAGGQRVSCEVMGRRWLSLPADVRGDLKQFYGIQATGAVALHLGLPRGLAFSKQRMAIAINGSEACAFGPVPARVWDDFSVPWQLPWSKGKAWTKARKRAWLIERATAYGRIGVVAGVSYLVKAKGLDRATRGKVASLLAKRPAANKVLSRYGMDKLLSAYGATR